MPPLRRRRGLTSSKATADGEDERAVRKQSEHRRRSFSAREVRPDRARNTAEARSSLRVEPQRKTAFAPGQTQHQPNALPLADTERDPPTRRSGKGRGERVAQPRQPAEQGSEIRPGRTRTLRNTTPRVDPANCRGRARGRNRGRYSPQWATALAGSPKPLEPTQLLIRSPRRLEPGAWAGSLRPSAWRSQVQQQAQSVACTTGRSAGLAPLVFAQHRPRLRDNHREGRLHSE